MDDTSEERKLSVGHCSHRELKEVGPGRDHRVQVATEEGETEWRFQSMGDIDRVRQDREGDGEGYQMMIRDVEWDSIDVCT